MSKIELHPGDNRESLRRLIDQGVRVHSVVTDPPYGLVSITKRFGKDKAAPAQFGTDGAFKRVGAGFMGSKWDGTGIERDPEFWALVYDILLPGGYVLAFSSTRTGHWQACAMETAGFVMHPFLGWSFGSGFPKAHNASRAIEAQITHGGASPKNMRKIQMGEDYRPHELAGTEGYGKGRMSRGADTDHDYQTRPDITTPEAAQWEGWAYGGQSLKPAFEPIYVGQKPFSEKNGALNLMKHGVGAINIDGCRVHGADPSVAGRHPANLLHDGSDEVVAMFPITTSGTGAVKRKSSKDAEGNTGAAYGAESRPAGTEMLSYGDTGSAARFFNTFPLDTDPLFYHPKAGKADRAGSKHPTVKPVKLMEWLVTLVTPPGGTVLDPFAGSGSTAQATRNLGFDCILMEGDHQFVADIRNRFDLADPLMGLLDSVPELDMSLLG